MKEGDMIERFIRANDICSQMQLRIGADPDRMYVTPETGGHSVFQCATVAELEAWVNGYYLAHDKYKKLRENGND